MLILSRRSLIENSSNKKEFSFQAYNKEWDLDSFFYRRKRWDYKLYRNTKLIGEYKYKYDMFKAIFIFFYKNYCVKGNKIREKKVKVTSTLYKKDIQKVFLYNIKEIEKDAYIQGKTGVISKILYSKDGYIYILSPKLWKVAFPIIEIVNLVKEGCKIKGVLWEIFY